MQREHNRECSSLKKTVIVIGALPSSLVNFRGDLIKAMVSQGHEVYAMASKASADDVEKVARLGATYIEFPVERNGLNPISDFRTLCALVKVFRRVKPDTVLSYTIKPIIWGGIAARICGVNNFYALVTGLGFAFQKGGLKRNLLTSMVIRLYKLAFGNAKRVIFQNPDNRETFISREIIEDQKAARVHGSGVNLEYFSKTPLPAGPLHFLCVARLLGEKGLREYAEASRKIREKYPEVRCSLLGPEDPSPDGIPLSEVEAWQERGDLDYLGETNDVRSFVMACHIYVLPSYHEGMPRTVLEAMSIGRPVITTDVPGCRETVINNENGFLVEKANANDLFCKMEWFITNPDAWHLMAERSRQLALERYDVNKVNRELLELTNLGVKK